MGLLRKDVLNPTLYARLEARFGQVRIDRKGQEMVAETVESANGPRLLYSNNRKGEYYRVCCPFCGDRRFRLYVSYRFGQLDQSGRPMHFLANCFNEQCLSDRVNREEFTDALEVLGSLSGASVVIRKGTTDGAYIPMWPAQNCPRLDTLPPQHEANVYLREERGFDPEALARHYDLRYCSSSVFSHAIHRIIIPCYFKGKMVGWQARYIGELDWKNKEGRYLPPKYFSLPHWPKSEYLLNYDTAVRCKSIIVVEGPLDVFSFGAGAVCPFGATLSGRQLDLIVQAASRPFRPIVLVFDPEAYAEKHVQELLLNPQLLLHPGGFVQVRLPAGTDPGSTPRRLLRKIISRQAEKQGVKVEYGALA